MEEATGAQALSLSQWMAGQGPEPRCQSCLSCPCWVWDGHWPKESDASVQPALPTTQVKAALAFAHLASLLICKTGIMLLFPSRNC